MPLPVLTRAPVVVAMTPPMVVSPEPVTVRVRVAPPTPPVARVPASEATVALPEPIVMAPDQVLAPARLRRAPVPPMPVPASVTGSPIASPEPSISSAAPEATVVIPAVVPRAVAVWTRTLPALTVVAPV